jgi:NAD(P)H-dependent FMN reductase
MPRLLVVHHTPSPAVHSMLEAIRDGATDPAIEGVEVVVRAALAGTAVDAVEAEGYLILTPANLGYLAGATKHFFDQIYYPCLEETSGRPFGVAIHGNDDTAGAERAVRTITTGLRWRAVAEPVLVTGAPQRADLDACRELGATVAARLAFEND